MDGWDPLAEERPGEPSAEQVGALRLGQPEYQARLGEKGEHPAGGEERLATEHPLGNHERKSQR